MSAAAAETAPAFPPMAPADAQRPTPLMAPPPPARAAAPATPIARLEMLLRDPTRFIEELDDAEASDDPAAGMASLTRALVGALVVGAGLFGAVIGAHRGGAQVLYCAAKVPLLLLLTLVVCAPPFIALARVAKVPLAPRAVIALALGSCARFALVLAGLAPVVWLIEGWSMGYHRVILAVVAACAFAGVAAGRLLFAGLSRAGGAGTRAGLAFVAVFAIVGSQASWLLRPFVVRPRSEGVPFVRALEGDFLEAVFTTTRSAAGVYARGGSRSRAPAAPCGGSERCD